MTLFAFDQGQGLSEHSAPFDALVKILDGEAEINIGGKPVRTIAGQTLLMLANVPAFASVHKPVQNAADNDQIRLADIEYN